MTIYTALVHKDADSAYGVQFPDLPGVFSAGDTLDEAMANAAEAIALFAEDAELPQPTPIEALISRPQVQAELQAGAVLLGIPHYPREDRTVRVNITLPASLLDHIDQAAQKSRQTRSGFLAQAAREKLTGAPHR